MADYNVIRSDGTLLIVNDGTGVVGVPGPGSTPSVTIPLVGQNMTSYGELVATSQVQLMENFANNTEPSDSLLGQLWYDSSVSIIKVNTGGDGVAAVWTAVGADAWVGTAASDLDMNAFDIIFKNDNTPSTEPLQILYSDIGPGPFLGFLPGSSAGAVDSTIVYSFTMVNDSVTPANNRSVTFQTNGNVTVDINTVPTLANDLTTKAYVDSRMASVAGGKIISDGVGAQDVSNCWGVDSCTISGNSFEITLSSGITVDDDMVILVNGPSGLAAIIYNGVRLTDTTLACTIAVFNAGTPAFDAVTTAGFFFNFVVYDAGA